MNKYITQEGAEELKKQDKRFHDAIFAHATLLAQKDETGFIDAVHVRKASKRVAIEQSSTIKWVLAISMLVLVGLAIFQMGMTSSQWYLWLLPVFAIAWTIIVTYVFRDFL